MGGWSQELKPVVKFWVPICSDQLIEGEPQCFSHSANIYGLPAICREQSRLVSLWMIEACILVEPDSRLVECIRCCSAMDKSKE
jgi:hypothetical protein